MDAWIERKIQVCGGDCLISNNDDMTLCTVLGSCIAACLYDPVSGIGGMNHYILPYNSGQHLNTRYGEDAFPLLLRKLGQRGAVQGRLRAKIFGGARMLPGDADIGGANIEFAEMFLQHNNIPIIDSDVGGYWARWIGFHPTTGAASIRRTRSRTGADPALAAS
jgi:chemotaxis protein CheD